MADIINNEIAIWKDATLTNLTISSGTLTPEFDPTITDYTVTVWNNVTDATVTPTKAQDGAMIEVRIGEGEMSEVVTGNASAPLSLVIGENTIEVRITAEDSITTVTYTIKVSIELYNPIIYVNNTVGSDNNAGTVDQPMATIQAAIDTAAIARADSRAENYIYMKERVSLYGGYSNIHIQSIGR